MEKEILEIDESFKGIALEIVFDEFLSFKATIDGKHPVEDVNTFFEYKINYLPERLKKEYIDFAGSKNPTLPLSENDLHKNHFVTYIEYLKFSNLGLLKERNLIVH